jgi:integrase
MQPENITIDLCEDYIARRKAQGYAADTVRLEMAYLRAVLRHAADRQVIPVAPKIPVPAPGKPRERYLSPDEVAWLIEASPEAHMKLFIALSVATAARPSHILQLQWEAVDFEHKLIDFAKVDKAAGNKQRPRIPMNTTAERELRNALLLRRTAYVIEWRGKPVETVKTGIRRASERAGLSDVTPYVLRHTAGVWMAKAGVSIEKIAAYMGHSNIEITRRHYAHFQPDFMGDAAGALELQPQKINMIDHEKGG